jgi:hypothetical protein
MLQQIIRQWIYPKELRISQPRTDLPCTLNALRAALVEKLTPQATATETMQYGQDDGPLNTKALAQVGTHLWRLKNKMIEPGLKKPRDEFSRVYRHLDAAWDVLAEAGIEILDLTGRPFDHGQSVRPLTFQPIAGLKRRTIVETVSPSILLRGKVIQAGEVIVGIPEKQAE